MIRRRDTVGAPMRMHSSFNLDPLDPESKVPKSALKRVDQGIRG
jgi:hypothetical protein